MKTSIKKLISNKKEGGFTLIEMITIVAITATLYGIVIGISREGERSLSLRRSAQIITQSVKVATNYSLGGKLYNGEISQGGYGIYVNTADPGKIIIFADCDADGIYDALGANSTCSGGVTERVEEKALEEFITITDICDTGASCGIANTAIAFLPPDPTASFTPAISGSDLYITITSVDGGSVDIYINELGVTRIDG